MQVVAAIWQDERSNLPLCGLMPSPPLHPLPSPARHSAQFWVRVIIMAIQRTVEWWIETACTSYCSGDGCVRCGNLLRCTVALSEIYWRNRSFESVWCTLFDNWELEAERWLQLQIMLLLIVTVCLLVADVGTIAQGKLTSFHIYDVLLGRQWRIQQFWKGGGSVQPHCHLSQMHSELPVYAFYTRKTIYWKQFWGQ